MNYNKYFIIVHLLLFSFCLCEISVGQKEKLLNGFIDYYNNLPNQIYTSDEGSLQNTQQVDETTYKIVVNLQVTELHNIDVTKLLKCTATVQDSDNEVTITDNHCLENEQKSPENGVQEQATEALVEVTEPVVERKPVRLDNEVQTDTAITSGEQFIAIPRDQPSASCIGCASHVNPQAAGVSDLANLGVRHLDIHEPSVKHSLDSVLDVERQVQVVNGVRYILTLSIRFNKCSEAEYENCANSKTCKITILVKPRVKLRNGTNYRAILANNCTEEWQYGDNGEVLPELSSDDRIHNQNGNTSVDHDEANASDDEIQVKHNTEVQSQSNQERTLTDEELKNLQEQIIPNNQLPKITEADRESVTTYPDMSYVSKQHVFKVESGKHSGNSIPVTESVKIEQKTVNINPDKKKAIDDMLDFFDFSGFKPKTEVEDVIPRIRRSYDYDLQVLSLAEDFHGIKKSIENARFMYELAQTMVDYLNEMDMEVKNRAVQNVIRAEEEIENLQHFVYVQARVTIPCDKAECDAVTQICNGVIDNTNENSPQILNTFCYNDYKERGYRDAVKEISLDDLVLERMAKEAVKKIESDSNSQYAMKINKIVSANTQITSGTLTKFSIIIDNIKCNKSVPLALRINCPVLEELGSKICEVIIHERHWLKERKISYTCTDRPVDMTMSQAKSILKRNITVDDPKIMEMLQEAIQYLETQSDKNNKQKIVNIKSISSQIIAGFLTKIEFVVGYTNCTDENISRDELNKCELLNNEGLRSCKAQIWDRSWITDGRQVEVSCDDVAQSNKIEKTRKKRSIDFIGGQVPQSVNNNNLEHVKLANESLKRFLHSSSSRQHYEVVKVDRVTIQDVPGKLIKIDFSISPTNCVIQIDGHPSLPKCVIVDSKNIFSCRSKILEEVWLHKKQYFVNCNTKDHKQQKNIRLDGLKEHNPSDTKYYQLAEESLKKYLNDTGYSPHHTIVRVDKVTTQIVSGLLTSIDFIISAKNQSDSNSDSISCHSEILEKHWLKTKDFNVTCQMQEKKTGDDLLEQKPDNPKYMHIAVESLQKYIKTKPDSNLVRVTFVDKVLQAGEITNISFLASHTEDDDGDTLCHAEFSEQGLFRSDIEVKCHSIGTVLRTEITEEDPKYFKYVQLADDSLHYYLQSVNSSQLYTVISIEHVTVKWDEGIKTLINFIVFPIDLDDIELQGKRCISQIREQPWLHKKHIKVKCEENEDLYRTKRQVSDHRHKRSVIDGGEMEQDPTEPRYKVLAEESLRKYEHDKGIKQPFNLGRVEKVTTQVVSGVITRIDFVALGIQNDVKKCHSEVWEQSWLNKKDIKVSCQNGDQRHKRGVMAGGEMEQDPTETRYKVLAEESLRKYEQMNGIKQPFNLGRVEKVTTQVVSGVITRIDFMALGIQNDVKKCHSEILEQPWLNNKNIEVSCQKRNDRVRKQLGGLHEEDPSKPQYKVLAEESLRKYLQEAKITEPLEVVQVEKVTTQVVSGSLTRIDFIATGSQDSSTRKCHSEVWEQSWLNKKDIKISCQNGDQRHKRGVMAGGEIEQDPTETQYKVLAEESLRKYEQINGIKQPYNLGRVEKVTTQVVSGVITRIDFMALGIQNDVKKCHSEVWEQSWLNKKDIKISCQNGDQRHKRGVMAGGEIEQDPTKPQYKVLAEESLRKYEQINGIKQPYNLGRVEKVTTQVVSGVITRIDFMALGIQNDVKKCHSEVWEQSWLNKKDIKISCQNGDQRHKRGVMAGGEIEQDPTETQYKVLAEESLRKYEQINGIKQPYNLGRVEKVTTQVVSGVITRIDFMALGIQNDVKKCHSEVWEQSWLNKKDIKISCQNGDQRHKRGVMAGGEIEQDPTETQYKVLAEESLRKYEQINGIKQPYNLGRVEKVTTQVVSGVITRIDFVALGIQNDVRVCRSEILEQPWLNNKNIEVSCQKNNDRVRRQLGGLHEEDPTKPQYKVLAEESLRKYLQEAKITEPLEVVQVEKVTRQVVSGSLTRIDFIATGSQDSSTRKCHSEVWEQSWLNKKDIKVSCQNGDQRHKRGVMAGGEMEQDPTKPQYKVLAEESLRKYVQAAKITEPLEVVQVEKVTRQVVSGSLTRIDFIATGSQDSSTRKCHSEVWEQSWLNKKDIKVSCQNGDQRHKRGVMAGGEMEQDPTKPQYKVLAEESLRKYVQAAKITEPLEVVQVEKVTRQVVSGSLTRIDFIATGSQDSSTRKCHSEVWEQSWLNKKDIKVSCQNGDQRHKRGVMAGGEIEQDPTETQYKVLAEESLRKYEQINGIKQPYNLGRVEKVTTQVVSGVITRIDFMALGIQNDVRVCHSEILEQPWLNNKNIEVSCQKRNFRVRKQLGGLHEEDPSKPQYKVLAEESLRKYLQEAKITEPLEVVQVEKVTTQVVSGSLTRIDFIATGSQDSSTRKCHSEVWEQSWLNKKDIKISCQNGDQRHKRGVMAGGEIEQDPTETQYKVLAEESLRKYEQINGIKQPYNLGRVEKVTTQVVSGVITRIDFMALGIQNDVKKCHSEVWEQSWLNKKDIKISCQNGDQRHKRGVMAGGEIEQDPTKPQYKVLAEESLRKYEQINGIKQPYNLGRVEKVTTQVVSGVITRIDFMALGIQNDVKKCHSEVWEQSWLNKKDIKISCQNGDQRHKRGVMAGGEIEQDPTETQYKVLAEESLRKYEQINGIKQPYNLGRVEKVTTQVVSGVITRIDFVALGIQNDVRVCHSEILEQPWLNNKNIEVSCQKNNDRVRRQLGGLHEEDPTKPQYKVLAEESLRKYLQEAKITEPLEVVQVEKVTRQVVSGSLTRIDFIATGSQDSSTRKCHSEVWEQSWLNKKDIKVSCQNGDQRHKRGVMAGGEMEQDPTKPQYKVLAEESLRKYVQAAKITEPLEVVQVEKVTRQVVSGSLTRIDFIATGSQDSSTRKCHSEVWEQSWLNKKDIKVSCQNGDQRHKRGVMAGGEMEQDPTKPQYKVLAEESLRKYVQAAKITEPLEVVQVEKVTRQVVSGSLTRIDFIATGSQDSSTRKCHSEVWEQSWLNKKDIKVSCQNGDQRHKRGVMAGGEMEQDPTKPQYKVLAEESLRKYVQAAKITEPLEVVQVEKVTRQVVSGSLTRIDFIATGSQDSSTRKCHSEVWEQSWLNKKDIKVSCQNGDQRHKRGVMAGGEIEQDPTETQYKVLAEESLRKYEQINGIKQPYNLGRVEKVTTQVVSGVITRIDFVALGIQNDVRVCHSEILEQPWLNNKNIEVSCQKNNDRVRRQLGGLHEEDPTKPQYKVLAEESLRKYLQEAKITEPLEVVQVEKVTRQVVSGSLTRIDFIATGSQDSSTRKCHSEVWEQSWLNKKDIKVSCQNGDQRHKRGVMAGGEMEQDPTKPQYKVLAEESLRKYVQAAKITEPLEVVQVEKVTRQVVSGSLTRIDFIATGSQDSSTRKCHSEVWEQSWLNKKDIKVSCQNGDQRHKRGVMAGGEMEQDPTKPQYKVLAEESLRKYVQAAKITEPLEVVQVEKVTRQVVSGSLTRIDFIATGSQDSSTRKCHSEVWEQSWLNKKDIKVSCQNGDQRHKRGVMAGGEMEQDPTKPQYKVLAEESLRKYVQAAKITEPLEVVQVEKVTRQVVSGSLTRIDFIATGSQDSSTRKCHSEVWEQSWLNKKDIKVSCQNGDQRHKRGVMAGGEIEQDPTETQYKVLAEESLRKYEQINGIKQPYNLGRVEKVTTQVVSGVITRIDFMALGIQNDVRVCHSEILEQPWLNNKNIEVSCQKRNDRVRKQLGGLHEEDPSKPQYKVLAEESLRKYLQEAKITEPLEVVQVEKVTTQVVSGSLTRIDFIATGSQDSSTRKCHSEVWEQSWLNKKDIKISCQNGDQRHKRGVMAGGEIEQDPTETQYKVLAEESLRKYEQINGIKQPYNLGRVEKVTTQVVSGVITRIDFMALGIQNDVRVCRSEILEQPWLNNKNIEVSCQKNNDRVRRQLGGLHEEDPTKPQYKVLAEESLRKYLQEAKITEPLEVVQVEKVTRQVVSGSLTRIDFIATGSQDSSTRKCHSEVWEQSWLNKKDIKVSCQNGDQRYKRGVMAGGEMEQDPTKPQYKVLAEESLRKYVQAAKITEPLEVVRVEKVTTQVVSGSLTRIGFIATGSQDSSTRKCHSEVWQQPWLNKKDIKVFCQNVNNKSSRVKRELIQGNSNMNGELHIGTGLRGLAEEKQDPNKPEYKRLAEDSLRKYEKKSSIYHKVVEIKRVVTRVVSGLKYKIDFSAAPTECSVNVSTHAHSCKTIDDVILYCHTEIWDRPWLKQKKIDIQCYGSGENDFEEYGSDFEGLDNTLKYVKNLKNHDKRYILLAEEASDKYLTKSNRKYVHKVTEVHSVSENIADGTITKIEYSLSPTTCLRNKTRGSNDTCEIKQPLITFHCNASIWDRPWLHLEKEIEVTCKKNSKNKTKKHKRELGVRTIRQIGDEDDEIDEDTTYYYADRAVQHVNDQSHSNNLHKLISIHAVSNSVQMGATTIRMYIELAETYCLRHHKQVNLVDCEEMDGLNHRLCLARLWPSPDDELVVKHVSVVCDDEQDFQSITGVNIPELLKLSIENLERSPDNAYKLIHQGEPQVIPSLDSKLPFKLNFIVATTNCSKKVNLDKDPFQCYINPVIPSKACHSFIWMKPETRFIKYINAKCASRRPRYRRSFLDATNVTLDNLEIQNLVQASLEKLEMSSLHRYKQRILQINSHSTKITSGKVTTIDFDVGYTSCLKYEWVEDITSCDFLEHLPRRRCVAQIWERLWIQNGKNIDVNCVDDETPLESHIEFESAEMANELAREALKHIEAKYPHPSKQKVVRIFSLEKQVVAGIHYKMKVEVGFTDCVALSEQTDCELLKDMSQNKFCRVNVWVRPWTDHPPNFRVSCDFQEGATHDLYHQVQAEHLFYNFLTTYKPSYENDYSQMQRRFEIFKANIKKIHEFNVHEKGTATYGVTRFTDLTYEEFSSRNMGLKTNLRDDNQLPMKKADIPDIKVPQNFDWREYDAVTDVKDQGSCGSCWAFSVTGNIEGQWKMQSGQLVSLSEQELVDCDKLDDGCNGGLPDNAYRAIEQLGGLEMEIDYPYEGVDEKCEFNKTLAKVQISGAVNITANETGMAQWLVHNGPISIGINANAMQFYMGGISHPWKMLCNPTNLDHGVLIVGYGIKEYPLFHKQLPYWIIKNSWGKSWGEQGYYRVFRGDGTCGVNQMASSAVV